MEKRTRRRVTKIGLNLPSSGTLVGGGVTSQGVLAADSGQTLAQWLASEFNHSFDAYDKAIDAVYNAKGVGGSLYHHIVDGRHDILSAFRAVQGVSADDTWLTEVSQAGEHLLRDMMSVSGINPFFSLTKEQFGSIGDLVAQIGISKPFLADALTLNGPELLGGSLALVGSFLLAKKAEPEKLSRFAGGCALSALASANPMLLPIAAGSLAYAAYKSGSKRDVVVAAGKGGLVSGSVILVSSVLGGPTWLGCVAGVITAVAVSQALDDPVKTFRRAQALVAPAAHVLKEVMLSVSNLHPITA